MGLTTTVTSFVLIPWAAKKGNGSMFFSTAALLMHNANSLLLVLDLLAGKLHAALLLPKLAVAARANDPAGAAIRHRCILWRGLFNLRASPRHAVGAAHRAARLALHHAGAHAA